MRPARDQGAGGPEGESGDLLGGRLDVAEASPMLAQLGAQQAYAQSWGRAPQAAQFVKVASRAGTAHGLQQICHDGAAPAVAPLRVHALDRQLAQLHAGVAVLVEPGEQGSSAKTWMIHRQTRRSNIFAARQEHLGRL